MNTRWLIPIVAGTLGVLLTVGIDTAAAQGRGRRGPPPTAGRPPAIGKPADVGRPPIVRGPEEGEPQGRGTRGGEAHRQHPRQGPQDERSFEALRRNPRLAERVGGLLPPGTDLEQAAAGFRNLGQFIAAAHVAHNLGLPFEQVKAKMVGEGLSLGETIRALRPDVDADREAGRALAAARETVRATSRSRRPGESAQSGGV